MSHTSPPMSITIFLLASRFIHVRSDLGAERRSVEADLLGLAGNNGALVGVGGTVSTEDSVVDVIRAYTANQGLSSLALN